jgi:8-amino-7-oxononanoate synthase
MPIQALMVGDNEAAMALSARLWSQRIFVPAIRPPTVPQGTARLRISLSAAHTDADIDELVAALRAAC